MNKTIFCILSVMLLFLVSCSVNDTLKPVQMNDQQGLSDDLNARKVTGPVFTVEPSGDLTGMDDTENLLAAFAEAKAAGPGATVQLVEGQYTIGMIEVRDFNGYFVGAGKGKTIISNAPDLPCNDYWAVDNLPFLLQFVGGSITLSDMTIRINDGVPCADSESNPWYFYWGDMLVAVVIFTDYTLEYTPDTRYIKGELHNVEFIGGDIGDGYNPNGMSTNTNMTIYCGAPFMIGTGSDPCSNADVLITGCQFEQVGVGPNFAGFGENGTITIENNVITGTLYGMFMYCNLGSKSAIRNNTFIDILLNDLYIDDNDYGYFPDVVLQSRTEWDISGNIFQGSPGTINILMSDFRRTVRPDEGFPQLFEIKFNTFNSQAGGTSIYGLNNVDAKIWNNIFKGDGAVGVLLDGTEATGTYAENCMIMGNNFSNANFADADAYLGEYTRNNTVVGVAADNIVDNGDDNKVIGVKANKHGPHYRSGMESNLWAINGKMKKPIK